MFLKRDRTSIPLDHVRVSGSRSDLAGVDTALIMDVKKRYKRVSERFNIGFELHSLRFNK